MMKSGHWLAFLTLLVFSIPATAQEVIGPDGGADVLLWLSSPQAISDPEMEPEAEMPADLSEPDPAALEQTGSLALDGVLPGETVSWMVTAQVTGGSFGLAMISFDLLQHPGNPRLFDMPPGDSAPPGMELFDRPAGFTNPALLIEGAGYGGTPTVSPQGHEDLRQVGGAQNTFGVAGPCFGVANVPCVGQNVDVRPGVGQTGDGQVIATGRFPAPDVPGEYLFSLETVVTKVLERAALPPESSPVRSAGLRLMERAIRIRVLDPGAAIDGVLTEVAAGVPQASPLPPPFIANPGPVRPRESATLTYKHVGFWWPPFRKASHSYELLIVEDDGSLDPFASNPGAILTHEVDGAEPRHLVTEGLEFGKSYAWKVLGSPAAGRSPQIGPVFRFAIAEIPDVVPELTVSRPEPGEVQPGVTLFNVNLRMPNPPGLTMAVDEIGQTVFFMLKSTGRLGVIELTMSGRLAMLRFHRMGRGLAAFEENLDGLVLWRSPADRDYAPHHDVNALPDGSPFLLLHDPFVDSAGEDRRGDRLLVLDRQTRDELWDWRTQDHYAHTDGVADNPANWTHGNAVLYNPADNSVYYSAKHFSRISRIDFATGQIVYNMGQDMPSGDTTFGDGLFYHQHAPEMLPNGNMLIFDNGNDRVPKHSRAVEVAFDDPDNPTAVTEAWSYWLTDEYGFPLFSGFGGDVDRLPNGNTLMTATARLQLLEVDAAGRLLWKLEPATSPPPGTSYRAQRLPALIFDAPGDGDGDQDLDLLDFGALQAAYGSSSPGPLAFPERLSDFDGNGAVDMADVEAFSNWMSGPGQQER
jgi:hypothetical protein